jgi:hypothetical protein
MFDAINLNMDGIFGAVLLASFVGWVAWRNGHKVRKANACAAFRSVLLSELSPIYPAATAWPENIDAFLESKFLNLQTAVWNFRPFLSPFDKWRFDRAWKMFYCTNRDINPPQQHYGAYRGSYSEGSHAEATSKAQALFHANVGRLLDFSDET